MKKIILWISSLALALTISPFSSVAAESGSSVIEPNFKYIFHYNDAGSTFNEGLAWVRITQGGQIGVIDRSGRILFDGFELSPYSYTVYTYSEGWSRVQHNGKWIYVDSSGKTVLSTDYDLVLNFREGLAAVQKNGKWGFINKKGQEIVKPLYDDIRDDNGYGIHSGTSGFHEGLAAIQKNGKWGYIDKTGREVIKPKYDWANNFSEGMAVVTIGGKWGYIDKRGAQAVKMIYDSAQNFSEGLGAVLRTNNIGAGYHWSFIDKTGKVVLDFKNKYEFIEPYTEGVSIAMYHQNSPTDIYVLLNKQGKEIKKLGSKYTEVEPFKEGLAVVRGRSGEDEKLIDRKGNVIVNAGYESLNASSQGLIGYENKAGMYGFIRNPLDVPSVWAQAEVTSAATLDLIPLDIDYGYTDNITRDEFSKLALQLISVRTGKSIEDLLTASGKQIRTDTFEDTFDPTVLAANALGIIQGKSANKLDPEGEITRQEASAMLGRVAEMLGVPAKPISVTYADQQLIADWAKSSVGLMSSLTDSTNQASVMGSIGDNRFGPKEPFTKQQAIIAMKRLYHVQ
ncbi:MAG: WG repeat-containing protein [Paenibacillus sp.]|uniref:WG repeat-containing protein n=1 Tax=Paenibacillus sp. TaxID=58172 RepID=UPI0029157820|nr:WG repeat-containing protein [Paenibacillus sp.]MDU4694972.1 WG repeat-containing protein [Paenibacillus sp.]